MRSISDIPLRDAFHVTDPDILKYDKGYGHWTPQIRSHLKAIRLLFAQEINYKFPQITPVIITSPAPLHTDGSHIMRADRTIGQN